MGWTTAGAAILLSLIMLVAAFWRPGMVQAITSGVE